MKKITTIVLILLLCSLSINQPLTINAQNENDFITTERLSNGDTITIEMITDNSKPFLNKTKVNKKSAEKKVTYKNSSGQILWSISVHGSFEYTGSSSKCISSSVIYSVPSTYWKKHSVTAYKSGNSAYANGIFKRYSLGLAVQTEKRTVKLSCSKKGVLS